MFYFLRYCHHHEIISEGALEELHAAFSFDEARTMMMTDATVARRTKQMWEYVMPMMLVNIEMMYRMQRQLSGKKE